MCLRRACSHSCIQSGAGVLEGGGVSVPVEEGGCVRVHVVCMWTFKGMCVLCRVCLMEVRMVCWMG